MVISLYKNDCKVHDWLTNDRSDYDAKRGFQITRKISTERRRYLLVY